MSDTETTETTVAFLLDVINKIDDRLKTLEKAVPVPSSYLRQYQNFINLCHRVDVLEDYNTEDH